MNLHSEIDHSFENTEHDRNAINFLCSFTPDGVNKKGVLNVRLVPHPRAPSPYHAMLDFPVDGSFSTSELEAFLVWNSLKTDLSRTASIVRAKLHEVLDPHGIRIVHMEAQKEVA